MKSYREWGESKLHLSSLSFFSHFACFFMKTSITGPGLGWKRKFFTFPPYPVRPLSSSTPVQFNLVQFEPLSSLTRPIRTPVQFDPCLGSARLIRTPVWFDPCLIRTQYHNLTKILQYFKAIENFILKTHKHRKNL